MNRKVIQIQVHGGVLIALCDDGTLWKLSLIPNTPKGWTQLPYIPED